MSFPGFLDDIALVSSQQNPIEVLRQGHRPGTSACSGSSSLLNTTALCVPPGCVWHMVGLGSLERTEYRPDPRGAHRTVLAAEVPIPASCMMS